MNVKLLVSLMTCVMVVNSQSTISGGDFVQCDDLRSEIESIRQLLKTQQKEIRDFVIQQQNRPRQGCPPGFDYLPEVGSCYKLVLERMTWDNATEGCRQMMPGVHLAAITNKDENDAVVRYLQSQLIGEISPCGKIWISGQTKSPRGCRDPFVWKPLRGIEIPFNYTNWNPGEPDCHADREHCVEITPERNYSWNDYICDFACCALCELNV